MKIHSRAMLAAVGLAVGAAFASPAMAQNDTQQTEQKAQTEQTTPAQSYDDATLESFAVAFLEVDKVKREYTPKLQQATSEEEQKQIQTEAGQKMVQAVEGTAGISVEEYNQIIQSAQADPELAQRLNNIIQQKSAE